MGNGTSQSERALNALSTEHFKVDDRTVDDLYREIQSMARAMKFYGHSAAETSQDWTPFFDDLNAHWKDLLAGPLTNDTGKLRNIPPHLSLVLAFIKLYGHVQSQLNALPSAHLNFFYRKVLGQERKPYIPDKVYVFFELARNSRQYVLAKGEPLLAGKDDRGNERIYTTDYKLFLTHSRPVRFKALQRSVKDASAVYAFPVVNSSDGFGAALGAGEGWFPFGDWSERKTSAEIGFAIVSPMLMLKEGKRKIVLSFALQPGRKPIVDSKVSAADLAAQLTADNGWLISDITDFVFDKSRIELSVELAPGDPPVVAWEKGLHGDSSMLVGGAMLKIILKDEFNFHQYTFLQSLHFTRVTVTTEVLGASGVVVRNDYGEIDAQNAFQPFGYHPVQGSNFYILYREAFRKHLGAATIRISWKGLPDDFKKHYEGYKGQTNSLVNSKDDFKVTAAIRRHRRWHDLPNPRDKNGEYSLFAEDIVLDLTSLEGDVTTGNPDEGVLRLTLSSPSDAFGHSLYPAEYAKAILGKLENKEAAIPNEPYTPVVEDIEFSYVAAETFDAGLTAADRFNFFHVKPFGISRVKTGSYQKVNLPLLSDEFHYGGCLFIGIQELSPPQQLSVFFEIRESTQTDKPNVRYFFLTGNGWSAFQASQILTDTTRGLQETGFVVLNLPQQMTAASHTLEPGIFWIMIGVDDEAASFDQIMAIRTNGVSCTARLVDPTGERDRVTVLPPEAITSLEKKRREIKSVIQPYSSFGGRTTEREQDYFLRVSEKLRHKGRAISAWDIERIILEQFPEVYRVKCIQHVDPAGEIAPGVVHIIVISYIGQFRHSSVVRPFVPGSTLKKIRHYVTQVISPHVRVNVTNPEYHEVKVIALINFNTQVDEGHYIKKMETELQDFLSPWTHGERDVKLGSTLYRSSIIEFIESRPYVNFISTLRIVADGREIEDQVIRLNERSILISSDHHDIQSIGPEESQCQMNQGIDEMIIDINFEIE